MPVEVDTVRAVTVPTRLVHGPGAVASLADEVSALRVSRPMLVTDPGVAAAGLVDRVLPYLNGAVVFDEVRPNPDIELVDQDGRKLHFYTDLVKGQTVAINFIFTTCTTICPPLGATFARVQKELGDKVGRDVRFISISVDPATDTPERLKAWGAKFHAGDGWTFVTGNKPQVDELLRVLGASSARREDHSPTVLIGNDAHGTWTRTYGLAHTSQLVQIINDMMVGKTTTTAEESN